MSSRLTLREDRRGPLRIWRKPEAGRVYVIGADSSSGVKSGDPAAASVIALDNGEQVATVQVHIDPHDFAGILFALGEYYGGPDGQAYLVLEINSHGLAVLEVLRQSGYWNFYTRTTWDNVEQKWQPVLGFHTQVKTRPMLINRARIALSDKDIIIRDPVLIDEASTFILNDAGKEEAMAGKHDDVLMSWMLAHEGRSRLFETKGITPSPKKNEPINGTAWVFERQKEIIEEKAAEAELRYVGMLDDGDDW